MDTRNEDMHVSSAAYDLEKADDLGINTLKEKTLYLANVGR